MGESGGKWGIFEWKIDGTLDCVSQIFDGSVHTVSGARLGYIDSNKRDNGTKSGFKGFWLERGEVETALSKECRGVSVSLLAAGGCAK